MTGRHIARTRWTCDHCQAKKWTRPSMERHERGCTRNPARICSMHVFATSEPQPAMDVLRAAAHASLDTLRAAADGCPACVLAAIRQEPESAAAAVCFDFKSACHAMFNALSDELARWGHEGSGETFRDWLIAQRLEAK